MDRDDISDHKDDVITLFQGDQCKCQKHCSIDNPNITTIIAVVYSRHCPTAVQHEGNWKNIHNIFTNSK